MVVIAAGDAAGASFEAHAEAFDHGFVGHQTVALVETGWRKAWEAGLVIAEYQQMSIFAVTEVVVDAFFFAQPLNEVQVGLVVLGAVLAFGVITAELKLEGVGVDAV